MRRSVVSSFVLIALLAGCMPPAPAPSDTSSSAAASATGQSSSAAIPLPSTGGPVTFGASIKYAETPVTINGGIAAAFSTTEIQNIDAMQKAYGVTFTEAERKALQDNKFVMRRLRDTDIKPSFPPGGAMEYWREMLSLYNTVRGKFDYKERSQSNSVFITSDVFFNTYSVLYTELLKEIENKVFYPSMKELSKTFYESAAAKVAKTTGDEQTKWKKIRNYFAVPYALLQSSRTPLTQNDYGNRDPEQVQKDFQTADKTVDTAANVTTFIKGLNLDPESEKAVLADIGIIFKAEGTGAPSIFAPEYEAYAKATDVKFSIDWTQFTPRSHYTSSSLRRQYFRSMMWFSQVPFFLKSPALTQYAFGSSQLLAENPKQLSDYAKLESAINFLVGTSDDLMPADYLEALKSAQGKPNQEAAIMEFLIKARNPQIKNIPANYGDVGVKNTDDVLVLTKGMRFFSGKFILDSYWTGRLTQGDEAPRPGYTQKLPPMASSLEVMGILGSDYAKSQIPTLDFYKPTTKEAIDQAMSELTTETNALTDSYWKQNLYTGWLWTIRSLFTWQTANKAKLPSFMQSKAWEAKTLQTGAGFWTELRHATLLYAKQSFAELGGGAPCDERKIPPPPKGYIEPQLQAYDRLRFLAARTNAGLQELGFSELHNMYKLQEYIRALEMAQKYVVKQLQNTEMTEVTKDQIADDEMVPGKKCHSYWIDGESDWENLRFALLDALGNAQPEPVEGPVLAAKDKRTALLADVHTGRDSSDPTGHVLYEGIGVPNVIFVAVKDTNGPRLTVGFTYSQYEFTEVYGGKRLTDEQWQAKFYQGDDPYAPFNYTPQSSWPTVNPWYKILFSN